MTVVYSVFDDCQFSYGWSRGAEVTELFVNRNICSNCHDTVWLMDSFVPSHEDASD